MRWVINLDRQPERWASFCVRNPEFAGERYAAVDGSGVGREGVVRAGLATRESLKLYTDKALGNALSHRDIWRRAVDEDEPTTVVEDDAVVAPFVVDSCDPDIIVWGWNWDALLVVELPFGHAAIRCEQDTLRTRISAGLRPAASPTLLRLKRCFGTPAYTVSQRGAQRLMELCFPLHGDGNVGIDCAMNDAYPQIQAYVAFPPLAVTPNFKDE